MMTCSIIAPAIAAMSEGGKNRCPYGNIIALNIRIILSLFFARPNGLRLLFRYPLKYCKWLFGNWQSYRIPYRWWFYVIRFNMHLRVIIVRIWRSLCWRSRLRREINTQRSAGGAHTSTGGRAAHSLRRPRQASASRPPAGSRGAPPTRSCGRGGSPCASTARRRRAS